MQKKTPPRCWIDCRLTFVENTIGNSPKVLTAKFLGNNGSFVILAYASLAASRTLLQQLLACLNFTLESEDLSLWYKRKKWFLWIIVAAQAAENYGDEWRLTWYFLWGIYTLYIHSNPNPLTKFTSSSKTNKFKDILPWNISEMIMKSIPISTRIVIGNAIKQGILLWIWWKVDRKWANNMIRISQWRESHCRTNNSIRRKK